MPLGKAFRRLIQILSAGIFLPGSVGLTDPCAPGPYRIHTTLTLEEQDGICMTAQVILLVNSITDKSRTHIFQTLNRALAHGAAKKILGFEDSEPIRDVLLLGEVVVTPSERVFEAKKENCQDIIFIFSLKTFWGASIVFSPCIM